LGDYRSLTIVAPEIAESAAPGQFLGIGMPDDREFLLRRHFAVHQASRRGGWAGTLEFVFAPVEPGARWLAGRRPHEFLDVMGPLGRGFSYPRDLTNCLLLGEGMGAASLYFLAQELSARHKRVDMIVAGRTLGSVFKPIEGKRLSKTISIVTGDGSLGDRGSILDVLPRMVEETDTEVVYASVSTPTLREVAAFCRARRIPAQVSIQEQMACGTGLCYMCVIPIARADRSGYDNLRACVEGPVFNPGRIVWERWIRPESAEQNALEASEG
jgi:dihydroorotate dehydrogenase electron transfer subunit